MDRRRPALTPTVQFHWDERYKKWRITGSTLRGDTWVGQTTTVDSTVALDRESMGLLLAAIKGEMEQWLY